MLSGQYDRVITRFRPYTGYPKRIEIFGWRLADACEAFERKADASSAINGMRGARIDDNEQISRKSKMD
jgi:hypothetical protein